VVVAQRPTGEYHDGLAEISLQALPFHVQPVVKLSAARDRDSGEETITEQRKDSSGIRNIRALLHTRRCRAEYGDISGNAQARGLTAHVQVVGDDSRAVRSNVRKVPAQCREGVSGIREQEPCEVAPDYGSAGEGQVGEQSECFGAERQGRKSSCFQDRRSSQKA